MKTCSGRRIGVNYDFVPTLRPRGLDPEARRRVIGFAVAAVLGLAFWFWLMSLAVQSIGDRDHAQRHTTQPAPVATRG